MALEQKNIQNRKCGDSDLVEGQTNQDRRKSGRSFQFKGSLFWFYGFTFFCFFENDEMENEIWGKKTKRRRKRGAIFISIKQPSSLSLSWGITRCCCCCVLLPIKEKEEKEGREKEEKRKKKTKGENIFLLRSSFSFLFNFSSSLDLARRRGGERARGHVALLLADGL